MAKGTIQEELRRKAYLVDKTLYEKEFIPSFPDEYELCVFCWARIGSRRFDYTEGFWEEESQSWICPDCAKEFSEAFCWKLIHGKRMSFAEYLAAQEDFEIPML